MSKRVRLVALVTTLGVVGALVLPDVVAAQGEEDAAAAEVQAILDNIWVLIAGFLVFFMQAGFALVEGGLTRSKNVVNIFAKNTSDMVIGGLAFFVVGYGIAFSEGNNWFGDEKFFLSGTAPFDIGSGYGNLTTATFFMYQVVFAGTAITICSGAMAERTRFPAYLTFSAFMCAIIYPVVVHWTWGGGIIADINIGDAHYSDFAGSGVVHLTGGVAAFVGAAMLGPRIGKYGPDGKPRAIPGHNIPMAMLGVFILWLGWFGFNPGSELAADTTVPWVALNTMLAALAAGFACTVTVWLKNGKPDLAMIGNGILAGLVGITAGCGTMNQLGAVITGAVAGVIVVFAVDFFDRIKVDDPVGALSVHGVCGVWGLLAIGLFARYPDAFVEVHQVAKDPEFDFAANPSGLFYGGGFSQLAVQALDALIIIAWVGAAATIVFYGIKKTIGLRVSAEEEHEGLDVLEHGLQGYAPDVVL